MKTTYLIKAFVKNTYSDSPNEMFLRIKLSENRTLSSRSNC